MLYAIIIAPIMNIYFYSLMLITGALTIYTDLREKKIRNLHLIIVSAVAIVLYCVSFSSGALKISLHIIINPLVGLAISFILYVSGLWKAGDAKLFFTYSLLLPKNEYSFILPLSCFTLFLNTFLISFLFILLLSVYDIIHNKNIIFNKVAAKNAVFFLIQTFFITLCVSWIIEPIIAFFPFQNNIFINFILLLGGYTIIYKFMSKIKNNIFIIAIAIAGLGLRYKLMPSFFSFNNIISYLSSTFIYSIIFYIITNIVYSKEEKPTRIPFSPFMLLGALLSNTGFLWWVMNLR